ncbi:Nitrilase/cyanide hydratase and apolipoprotein N-acyltransferase [Desulfotomaculum nigrificans CO-1-SRB]|uniref:Nitrilase/cyanide hydratase and apolipoprotein N-acyltransferase n=1 Tax=Desulfotomaculum nigrificans (strain DSM 14880 / VKM B-2319 / CO-1-SRB) TaxID=868595 RepID=F6B7G8_DESCC|nr:carbon-nitrogen hydrolase family protein [Desulfotomaculum nigrificans]AEF94522.1 Nitrilase/cyanide hydratase and apolipoprotein N-acyltransferase [Desulfotomaculum nigrificans CO-1-SRB]
MSKSLKLGLCQIPVSKDKTRNLQMARAAVKEAVLAGSQLVALPEMFNCPYDNKYFAQYAEEFPQGETLQMLSHLARAESVYLVGGSLPEREANRLYNSCFIFGPQGELLARHRKVHLFDIDIPGGISFRESDTLTPGDQITTFNTPFCRVGVAICYDIRFPELTRLMALQGIKLLILPAAFNMTTGPAHWELTMRARALDNQIYVAAVSPARDERASYVAYGHTMVADPWGNVIAQSAEKPQVLTVDIDLARLADIRAQLPLLKHRRADIY